MSSTDENPNPDEVKERKRRERLEQNRISARESRKRKKTMIEELQRTVIGLSRDNKDLNDRNESLRRQLMDLGTKYPQVVPLHAIMGGSLAGILGEGPMAQVQAQLQAQTQQQQQQVLSTSVPMPLQYQLDLSQQQDQGQDDDQDSLQQGNTKFSVPIPVSAETPSSESSTAQGYHHGELVASNNNLSEVKQNVDAS
mmetsp:Transcript_525/g.911  ORF Transcript_525/g.911 Transcript_525/m.911 type:complete len:197 (-) Transcript_525:988-1578(-)